MSEKERGIYADGMIIPIVTLRDYFAIRALVGLLGNPEWFAKAMQNIKLTDITADEYFSKAAYKLADSMLEARKQ